MRGGLCDGIDLIEVRNGALSFRVLPTRGMQILDAEYAGLRVGWDAPVRGPVHPKFINIIERGGLGWLQGFSETLVRCGLASNGPPVEDVMIDNQGNESREQLTLHGRIANIPAHQVAIEVIAEPEPAICVSGVVDESMLFGTQLRLESRISTVLGSSRIQVNDEIVNLKTAPSELELLYHCNFSGPFLEAGAQILAPIADITPRNETAQQGIDSFSECAGPTPGFVEQVFFLHLNADATGRSLAMLQNAAADKAIVVRADTAQLPCFTVWKNTAAEEAGYVLGLEPGTDYPNPRPFERHKGRLVTLGPKESYHAQVTLDIRDNAAAVAEVQAEIDTIQAGRQAVVNRERHPDLCG
jgi:hypothetical protein